MRADGRRAIESGRMGMVALVVALASSTALGFQGAPARKDSSARLRPAEVTYETAIVPATAKPGEVVRYEVRVKVEEPWHIYGVSDTQPEEGPRSTQFDLFETGGLVAEGAWAAEPAAVVKPEPAFNNKPFASHEGSVVWSRALKVPADAKAGELVVRSQISFQICNASTCKPPARVTVPDAKLTIEAGAAGPQTAEAVPKAEGAAAAAEPGMPKRKDSSAAVHPPEVVLSAKVEPTRAKAGDVVTYSVTADIEAPWHIYAFSETQAPLGPKATQFDLFQTSGLVAEGEWAPDAPPTVKNDPAFDNKPFGYHEGRVVWSRKLRVPAGTAAGSKAIQSQIYFMICRDTNCKPATRISLEPVMLEVEPGGAEAVSSNDEPTPSKADVEIAAGPLSTGPMRKDRPAQASQLAEGNVAQTASSPRTSSPGAENEVSRTIRQGGLLPFLLLSAGAGLLSLVMPCVWPMVPITVNFFVKQGQSGRGSTVGLAVTYCLAIIGIFTAVGLLFSLIFGASAAQGLATNGWFNLAIGLMFVAFGLSLLGVFEFRLPSFLVNASSEGAGRGGLVGVIFMALTLTITSFSCTFPVVGALLVMAANREFLYPILGLVTFSTVLALPFFLLALAPNVLKAMPKSGDWMNAVKLVGGLIELGAALKFLNNAEIGFGTTPEDAWTNVTATLTVWVVLSAVSGFYLLGFFRTDHDTEEPQVGAGRILFGVLFLSIALFLSPALFGRIPKSIVWDRLIVGLLPFDVDSLGSSAHGGVGVAGGSGGPAERHATSTEPKVAETEESRVHGVEWGFSYEQAVATARAEGKPVLLDFTGVFCANCRQMEQSVFPRAEVVERLQKFVTVSLYTDQVPIKTLSLDQKEELATVNVERQQRLVSDVTQPFYVALKVTGPGPEDVEVLGTTGGYMAPSVFVKFLDDAISRFGGAPVAATARAEGAETGR